MSNDLFFRLLLNNDYRWTYICHYMVASPQEKEYIKTILTDNEENKELENAQSVAIDKTQSKLLSISGINNFLFLF